MKINAAFLATLFVPAIAMAVDPIPSQRKLPTGNGYGLMLFDGDQNALVEFLERPYRFMRSNPSNPDAEGIVRRDLAFDAYFGIRSGSSSVWLGKQAPAEFGYVDQTNVIRSVVDVGNLRTETFYVSPFGLAANGVVMFLRVTNTGSTAAAVDAFAVHNFKMGSAPNPNTPGDNSEAIAYDVALGQVRETGPGGGTMLYVSLDGVDASSCDQRAWQAVLDGDVLPAMSACNGTDKTNVMQKQLGSLAAGESRMWAVALLFTSGSGTGALRSAWDIFAKKQDASDLLESILAEWRAWRGNLPGLSGEEAQTYRQSEAVLRMGQILEPYSESPKQKQHGMILASLSPGQWHIGWVRDSTYALVALARSGHYAEAKRGLNFFLDSDAGKYKSLLNNVNYRVSTVRYFGNGEEEADFSGQPTRNIEVDGWGLVLWAARQYIDASGDSAWLNETTKKGDRVYQALREGVAEALAANIEESGIMIADASIWEVHWGNRQYFLYTTASAARGLCDMAAIARRHENTDDQGRYKQLSDDMVIAMKNSFADPDGVLAGSVEKLARGRDFLDGAVVEAFTWDLVSAKDPIMISTMNAMSRLRTSVGGFKRLEGSSDPYDTDEWIFVDLRGSEAFRRINQNAQADQLLDWVTAQASANHNLIPELYNSDEARGAIGRLAGSIPMVGYGAGAYILTMLHRQGATEHRDCGTVDPGSYADAGTFDDGGPDGNGAGLDGHSDAACKCNASGGVDGWLTVAILWAGICWMGKHNRRHAKSDTAASVPEP